ncbi:MAG: aldo/keto reductase [Pseudomonadota bacterium]
MLTTISGAPASTLTFGTMQFGGTADAKASAAMFDACRAAGLNHFDTAHMYTSGASEEVLGALIQQDREALLIATKCGYTGGAGRATIQSNVDDSRRRLGLDTLDILYMHRFDPETALDETFDTLATLQAKGHIRYIGVSNYAAWQVMKAQAAAAAQGTRIDIIQPMYSLVKRQAEVELFPMAQDQGIAIAPYSPLGSGLLTGKYVEGGTGRLSTDSRYAARYGQDWMHDTAAALSRLAARDGVAPATLAVAWAAAHPAGPAPIISARSAAQLAPSLAAASFPLSAALYAEITALSPTPAPATDRLEEA